MDRFSFLGSVHANFIDDLYEEYLNHPDAVEPSWRAFFQGYDFARENYDEEELAQEVIGQVPAEVLKEFKVLDLIAAYRSRGHLFTQTNPVRVRRKYEPNLDIENFGLSESDLDIEFNAAAEVGASGPPLISQKFE